MLFNSIHVLLAAVDGVRAVDFGFCARANSITGRSVVENLQVLPLPVLEHEKADGQSIRHLTLLERALALGTKVRWYDLNSPEYLACLGVMLPDLSRCFVEATAGILGVQRLLRRGRSLDVVEFCWVTLVFHDLVVEERRRFLAVRGALPLEPFSFVVVSPLLFGCLAPFDRQFVHWSSVSQPTVPVRVSG